MPIKDLLLANRSYRRYEQTPVMSERDLRDLIDSVRLSPSSRNDQALKFILVHSKKSCQKLFPLLAWAGYLSDWPGPNENERPTSYIIVLGNASSYGIDIGIAAQSILLTSVAKGFGGCILASINRPKIKELFSIEDKYEIPLVIALGKPAEKIAIEKIVDNNIKYYRDEDSIHHVPKRTVEERIIKII